MEQAGEIGEQLRGRGQGAVPWGSRPGVSLEDEGGELTVRVIGSHQRLCAKHIMLSFGFSEELSGCCL